MPDIKIWIVIGLIVFSWAQYTYPSKTQSIGDMTFGKLNTYIKVKGTTAIKEQAAVVCPTTISQVCGSDGVTYDNMCKAALAGVLSTTPGGCTDET